MNNVNQYSNNAIDELEQMRRMLAASQSEVAQLRKVASDALDVARRAQSAAGHTNGMPSLGASTDETMTKIAATLHQGGLSSSVGETVLSVAIRDAYVQYAEVVSIARRSSELQAIIDERLLKSAYASGTDPLVAQRHRTADDYQKLHNFDKGYQDNNWLVDHCDAIRSIQPRTVVEVGCGNGRFLRKISAQVPQVIGLDWARSPHLRELPANVEFRTTDVLKDDLATGDICVSADVLEHFEPSVLPNLIRKMHAAARYNYHVIACYDDGHSHCSVFHPGQWTGLFQLVSPDYRLVGTITRPGRPDRIACVITNVPNAERFFPKLGPIVGTWGTADGKTLRILNNFKVDIGGTVVASWFPMANGTAAIKWNENNVIDLLALNHDGSQMTVQNSQGVAFTVRKVS